MISRRCSLLYWTLVWCVSLASLASSDENSPYPFAIPAEQALAPIQTLKGLSPPGEYEPTADEQGLFKTIHDSRKTSEQWIEAFLIASGELDSKARSKKVKELCKLADAIGVKTRSLSDFDRGEKILRELHESLMAAGYDKDQSNVAEVFRSHKFNCVSSSVLYFLLCDRLKQTLQIVEFKGNSFEDGHVMVMYQTAERMVDVETTNPEGFDIRRKIAQGGGFAFGIKELDRGNKIDTLGLLRSVYNNRAVAAYDHGQYYGSLNLNWMKLFLSPDSKEAQDEFMGAFTNWTMKLAEAGDFRASIQVASVGLRIAPDHPKLINNLRFAHEREARKLIESKMDSEVIQLFSNAEKSWPSANFSGELITAYRLVSQELESKSDHKGAIALFDRVIELSSGETRSRLEDARIESYRKWSQDLIQKSDFPTSAMILKEAFSRFPKHPRLVDSVYYLAQESYGQMIDGPLEPFQEWVQNMKNTFPEAEKIDDFSQTAIQRVLKLHLSAHDYAKGHAFLTSVEKVLGNQGFEELDAIVFDEEATSFVEKKDWATAAKTYATGLSKHPKSSQLLNNAPLLYNTWASQYIDKKEWMEAIRIYKLGLASYPTASLLKGNLEYCEQEMKRK